MIDEKAAAVFKRILDQSQLISEIQASDKEYYFLFKGHAFSITRTKDSNGEESYSAFVYPKWSGELSDLVSLMDRGDIDITPIVHYPGIESEDQFFFALLRNLYLRISSIYLNLDNVFDDILQ